MMISFSPVTVADILGLPLQESQHISAGVDVRDTSPEEAALMVEGGPGWTARRGQDVLACYGFYEVFHDASGVGVQANIWAMLAGGLSIADRMAITRFARARVVEQNYARVEAICCTGAEVKWAILCGLRPLVTLRNYGADSIDHLLMERLRP